MLQDSFLLPFFLMSLFHIQELFETLIIFKVEPLYDSSSHEDVPKLDILAILFPMSEFLANLGIVVVAF